MLMHLALSPYGANNNAPLFAHKDGSPVQYHFVMSRLKELLISADIGELDMHGAPSLRRGGALTLALAGVPDRVIQRIGRWKSEVYRVYLDLSVEEWKKWMTRVATYRS